MEHSFLSRKIRQTPLQYDGSGLFRPESSVVELQLIHGKLADLAAVAAIVAAVLAEAHPFIGLAEDAVFVALASDFRHVTGTAEIFGHTILRPVLYSHYTPGLVLLQGHGPSRNLRHISPGPDAANLWYRSQEQRIKRSRNCTEPARTEASYEP